MLQIIRLLLSQNYLLLFLWICWFLYLWYLSSGPLPEMKEMPPIISADKLLHWGYFGIGGAIMAFYTLSVSESKHLDLCTFFALLCLGAFTGAVDEWHQSWVENRSGLDPFDWIADIIGTGSGLIAAPYLSRLIFSDLQGKNAQLTK